MGGNFWRIAKYFQVNEDFQAKICIPSFHFCFHPVVKLRKQKLNINPADFTPKVDLVFCFLVCLFFRLQCFMKWSEIQSTLGARLSQKKGGGATQLASCLCAHKLKSVYFTTSYYIVNNLFQMVASLHNNCHLINEPIISWMTSSGFRHCKFNIVQHWKTTAVFHTVLHLPPPPSPR